MRLRTLGISVSCFLLALSANAQPAPAQPVPAPLPELATAQPSEVGLSEARLQRMSDHFEAMVERGEIAGALGMIARHGKVAYVDTWGDQKEDVAMTEDTLFRIYSMTKPITSAAVLMLYEEGHFLLKDPVSKFLPELTDLQVLLEVEDPETGEIEEVREPAKREITIRDLLSHRSGMTYGFFGDSAVDKAYREKGILGEESLAEMITHLGELPLVAHPGESWQYGVSTDVLGRLVEVVSDQRFGEFLEERIFKPLGMNDTAFTVSDADLTRFSELYVQQGRDGEPAPDTASVHRLSPAGERYLRPFRPDGLRFESGGGGLVSTADDFMRFCLMLLNGGELNGVRLLSRKTVELMRTSHVDELPWPGYGFGLGGSVLTDLGEVGELGSVGEFSWGGMAGTSFWIDPQENLAAVFMIQILPHNNRFQNDFHMLTYQSIVD